MNKLLLSEKIPYFFTVLFALVVYQLNNITTTVLDAPNLVYNFHKLGSEKNKDGFKDSLECELININRKKSYKEIKIYISYRTEVKRFYKLYNPEIIAIAPSGLEIDSSKSLYVNDINEYFISRIQPQARYVLKLTVQRSSNTYEYPKLYLSSPDDIRLIESSLETFLVDNRILLNIILLLIWLGFIAVYIYYLIKENIKLQNL